jgi:alpha-tubulin suppressor-like RCC1 family protein
VFHGHITVISWAVQRDGTVWEWGITQLDPVSDEPTTDPDTPMQVAELAGAVQVAGGQSHSLTLKSDGTIWAWGDNYGGQLGDATAANVSL